MNAKLQPVKVKFTRRKKAIIAGVSLIGFLITAVLGLAIYDRYSTYGMLYGENGLMYSNSSINMEDIALPDSLKAKINYRDDTVIEAAADEMIDMLNTEVSEGVDTGFPGWVNLHILGGQNRKDAEATSIRESHIQGEKLWDALISAAFVSQMCDAIGNNEERTNVGIPQHMKKSIFYVSDITVDDIREHCISNRQESHVEGEIEYAISEKYVNQYSKILKLEQSKYKSNPDAYLAEASQPQEEVESSRE